MGIRFRMNYYINITVVGPFTPLSITYDLNWPSLSVQSLGGNMVVFPLFLECWSFKLIVIF